MAIRGQLHKLTATTAAQRIAEGKLTSVELVEACLARIAEREDDIRAWAFIDRDLALAQARARDAEKPRGPLHGVPVGIKDVIDTEDMPTEYGSKLYAGHRPKLDAATVTRLKAQGAVILGKARTTEFACPYPTITRNPHDFTRTPGVSSSGSAAAVADFMVPLANGTQTGGSVIRPAALCGIYGYKGTLDHLDRAGIRHLKPSIDTLGLFARSLDDLMLMRAALVHGAKAKLKKPRKLKIGVARTHVWPHARPEAVAMIEQAQRILGAETVELSTQFEENMKRFGTITRYEGLRLTDDVVKQNLDAINPWARESYEGGLKVTRSDYEAAVRDAQSSRALIARTFESYDVLITPACAGEAPADLQGIEGGLFNALWTQLHVPCVTIPAFQGPNGMPVGLQIVGPHGGDALTLAAASLIEARLKQAAGKLPIRVP
jgi:Asp-tRNA(Asn)/Glu-tRNA(Gln) amidotransferase A subunit family amidase